VDAGSPASVINRLREAGLRVTHGRLAVYDTLVALGGHRSADQVHEALITRGDRFSRTSVYSTLEAFTRAGMVVAADAGPGRALYEAGGVWHHHAVCRECGEVSDVECVVGAKPCLEASGDWGDVDEAQIIFRGVCRRCLSRARKRTTPRPMTTPRPRRNSN
jgi:Fur family ferric uptake transcriptional regulator